MFSTETGGFPDAKVVPCAGGMKVMSDAGATLWTLAAGSLIDPGEAIDALGDDNQCAP